MENSKIKIISIIMVAVALVIIGVCSIYLISSKHMIDKYDVNSFKLGKYDIPSFNSALKSKKKLVYANDKDGIITLKYDIKNIKLNDVYAYLEKLSKDDFVVLNLEDLYMRTVNNKKNIQIKINVGSKHLIFEYKIGIDATEKTDKEKKEKIEEKTEKTNEEQSA